MEKKNILDFYKRAMVEKKFSIDFVQQLKDLDSIEDLRKFIEDKVCPIAQGMGYDFTVDELLSYEIATARKLSDEELESITGGVSLKYFVLGGVVSLLTMGGGVLLSNTAHAELSSKEIAGAYVTMEQSLESKVNVEQRQDETQSINSQKSTSGSESDEFDALATMKSKTTDVKSSREKVTAEVELPPKSDVIEDVKLNTDDYKTTTDTTSGVSTDMSKRKSSSQIDNLEVVQKSDLPEVDLKELADEQKLYILKALNLQDAYALLLSGMIENLRFSGNITDVELDEQGKRIYRADNGDAFTDLLYMLYPSNEGELNIKGNGKYRSNFSDSAISPELMAKFCALLNEYRSDENVRLPQEIAKNVLLSNGKLDKTFVDNINWLVDNGFDKVVDGQGNLTEFSNAVKQCFNVVNKNLEMEKEAQQELNRVSQLKELLNGQALNNKQLIELISGVQKYNSNAINKCLQEHKLNEGDLHEQLEAMDEAPKNNFVVAFKKIASNCFKSAEKKINNRGLPNEDREILIGNSKKGESKKDNSKSVLLLISFIEALGKSVDAEKAIGSIYPEYLTEHILMSYMIKVLDTSQDVEKLYQEIVKQLAVNKSSKIKRSTEIESAKDRLNALSNIFKNAEVQYYSPYKSEAKKHSEVYMIGSPTLNGEGVKVVKIHTQKFPDCADISERHLVNLLSYSNNRNWDLFFKDANMTDLKDKLQKVIKAIETKSEVQFYDFKDRLQMFFLYQSQNSADDGSTLARTLWEYAICNMDHNNISPELLDKGYYEIEYSSDNVELSSGYENMLKLMYNIAKALKLSDETSFNKARETIDILSSEVLKSESVKSDIVREALLDTFNLYHSRDKIRIGSRDDYQIESFNGKKIVGSVEVFIEDRGNLSFNIKQLRGHTDLIHTPVILDSDDYIELSEEHKKDNYFRALFKKFKDGDELTSFFELFSARGGYDSNVDGGLKPNVALLNWKALQGEENNIFQISCLATKDVLDGAKLVTVKQGKNKFTLYDILYSQFIANPNHDWSIYQYKLFFYNCDARHKVDNQPGLEYIRLNDKQARIFFNSEAIKDGKVVIPSQISAEGEKLDVVAVGYGCDIYENLNLEFNGDFENLKIDFMPKNITSVAFTGTVKNLTIGNEAFLNCENLERFEVPEGVIKFKIGSGAFSGCKSLVAFTGKGKNLTIGNEAFFECEKLESFKVPEGVIKFNIDNGAFSGCKSLLNFTMPTSLQELDIDWEAFEYCSSLRSFTVNGDLETLNFGKETLGSQLFSGCEALKIFTVNGNVKTLNFVNVTIENLQSFVVNGNVETMGFFCTNFENLQTFEVNGNV